jgi:hypothetical protein
MRTRRGRATVCATATLTLLLAGCGSESPGISDEASQSLETQVQAVRQSAQSFDPAGVESGLAELRTSVARLKADGEIDDQRAAVILAAATDVEAQLDVVPTTTTAPPPPATDDDHKGEGKGKGGDDD